MLNRDMFLWNAMLSVCVKSRQYFGTFEILREMQYICVRPNHVSIVSILPACAALGTSFFGRQIHGMSIKLACQSLTNVQNSLVDMYSKCGILRPPFKFSLQLKRRISSLRGL